MQTLSPPVTAHSHISLTPSSSRRISSRGSVSPLSAFSLFGELFIIKPYCTMVPSNNDIFYGDSKSVLNNVWAASKPSSPLFPPPLQYPPQNITELVFISSLDQLLTRRIKYWLTPTKLLTQEVRLRYVAVEPVKRFLKKDSADLAYPPVCNTLITKTWQQSQKQSSK